jgi:hypothetical protein
VSIQAGVGAGAVRVDVAGDVCQSANANAAVPMKYAA